MLPRSSRLSKDWLISKVRRRGRRISGRFCLAFVLAMPNSSSPTRCAIIVAKQVSKLAVERNLAKRRVSEVLHEFWPRLRPGFSLVLSLSPRARQVSYQELRRDLASTLLKARLLD